MRLWTADARCGVHRFRWSTAGGLCLWDPAKAPHNTKLWDARLQKSHWLAYWRLGPGEEFQTRYYLHVIVSISSFTIYGIYSFPPSQVLKELWLWAARAAGDLFRQTSNTLQGRRVPGKSQTLNSWNLQCSAVLQASGYTAPQYIPHTLQHTHLSTNCEVCHFYYCLICIIFIVTFNSDIGLHFLYFYYLYIKFKFHNHLTFDTAQKMKMMQFI